MQNFPEPVHKIKCSQMSDESLCSSENILDSFPIYSIYFLIPSLNAHREKFEDLLVSEENIYFIVKNITVKNLINKVFLDNFVKSGSLVAISHNARAEKDNFLSIISSGKLVLSLEKSIAKSLALHKENPCKKKKDGCFQTIIIDLICPEFYPGKKHYESISFELSKIDYLKFTVLLKWKPQGNVCCHSIRTYFLSQGYECDACKPSQKYFCKLSVSAPEMNLNPFDTSICTDILEWVGAQICGIEYSNMENEYVSKFIAPEPSEVLNKLHICSFEGLYSKTEVLPVIKKIRNIIEKDSSIPFIVVCLSGFQDSYIVGNGFQYFSSEDKLICLLLSPSSNSCIIALNAR